MLIAPFSHFICHFIDDCMDGGGTASGIWSYWSQIAVENQI